MRCFMNVKSREPITRNVFPEYGLTVRYHGTRRFNLHLKHPTPDGHRFCLLRMNLMSLQFGDEDKIPVYINEPIFSRFPTFRSAWYHFLSMNDFVSKLSDLCLGSISNLSRIADELSNIQEDKTAMRVLKQEIYTTHLLKEHAGHLIDLGLDCQDHQGSISYNDVGWKLRNSNLYERSQVYDNIKPVMTGESVVSGSTTCVPHYGWHTMVSDSDGYFHIESRDATL